MEVKSWSTAQLVVVSLGVSLAVFFAGASAAVAAGVKPPTALWAAGSAVSGALVGLLAPAPGTRQRYEAAAHAAELVAERESREAANQTAAAEGAGAAVAAHQTQARIAKERYDKARAEAESHNMAAATTPETRLATTVLFTVFVILLTLGVFLSAGGVVPPPQFTDSLKNITTAVLSLAAAAGTALIGVLTPTKSG